MTANSLDLDLEMGAIELFEEVEQAFGIVISDADATGCATVGDLEVLIARMTAERTAQGEGCASPWIFNRLRRALPEAERADFRPRSTLPLGPRTTRQEMRLFAKESGLRVPARILSPAAGIGCLLMATALPATYFLANEGGLSMALIGVAMALVGLVLFKRDRGKLPRNLKCVGDLVTRMVALNAAALRAANKRLPDRWALITELAAEHGSLAPGDIRRDTVFHDFELRVSAAA